jgi:hypothetical protein
MGANPPRTTPKYLAQERPKYVLNRIKEILFNSHKPEDYGFKTMSEPSVVPSQGFANAEKWIDLGGLAFRLNTKKIMYACIIHIERDEFEVRIEWRDVYVNQKLESAKCKANQLPEVLLRLKSKWVK